MALVQMPGAPSSPLSSSVYPANGQPYAVVRPVASEASRWAARANQHAPEFRFHGTLQIAPRVRDPLDQAFGSFTSLCTLT